MAAWLCWEQQGRAGGDFGQCWPGQREGLVIWRYKAHGAQPFSGEGLRNRAVFKGAPTSVTSLSCVHQTCLVFSRGRRLEQEVENM